MPLETREQSVPMFHEVEATLVEEEPEVPIIDAIPMQEVTWCKKYQRCIVGGMCVLLIGLAVTVGVLLGSNDSTSNNESNDSIGQSSPSDVSILLQMCIGNDFTMCLHFCLFL